MLLLAFSDQADAVVVIKSVVIKSANEQTNISDNMQLNLSKADAAFRHALATAAKLGLDPANAAAVVKLAKACLNMLKRSA